MSIFKYAYACRLILSVLKESPELSSDVSTHSIECKFSEDKIHSRTHNVLQAVLKSRI
jgi:hypothetical protein